MRCWNTIGSSIVRQWVDTKAQVAHLFGYWILIGQLHFPYTPIRGLFLFHCNL